MKWTQLVFSELLQRKNKLITSALAITLGVAVIVMINSITTYSEKAISKELDALGANILILPQGTALVDYYSADLQDSEIPEEYVTLLATSDLEGLDNLSPKLSVPVVVNGESLTLTGILPKNEFQSKTCWQGAGIFSRPKTCGDVDDIFGFSKKTPEAVLARKRVIETLESNEVLIGSEVASALNLIEGSQLTLLTKVFNVSAVLPQTGTIDDSRIFAHLHSVQALTGKESVVNAIEVVGCCEQISKGLVGKIGTLLPGTKIVTITQVVDTQVRTNELMRNLSKLFLVIILVVGGASIANDMYNNVYERRREVGTLVALGASSNTVLKVFLTKALILGLVGGIAGFVLGTLIAVICGPLLAGVPVLPIPQLLVSSVALSVAITLLASYFPARYATRLDPSIVLQEV
ncbi:MAG: ABC transporter permease [Chlamydiales bacterium]|nr:ABC transporter permease [Chlamydiales bacterium]